MIQHQANGNVRGPLCVFHGVSFRRVSFGDRESTPDPIFGSAFCCVRSRASHDAAPAPRVVEHGRQMGKEKNVLARVGGGEGQRALSKANGLWMKAVKHPASTFSF